MVGHDTNRQFAFCLLNPLVYQLTSEVDVRAVAFLPNRADVEYSSGVLHGPIESGDLNVPFYPGRPAS